MPDRYTIAVEIEARDKTGTALGSVKKGFDEAFNQVVTGALRAAGEGLLGFVQQIPAMTVELGKLGVSVQASERRFSQFAGGADRATMFLNAFNEGSLNTVDRMTAMSSAGRLLQMGLVDTGDEMSQIAAMATQLGDQTMGAGERIADFAALLANQSIPRLDNFGISSGRVRQRIDELLESGRALNREQAFKMAVMEEGSKALDTLGDTSDLASVRIAKVSAALETVRQEAGKIIAEDFAGALEAMSTEGKSADEVIRDLPTRFREWREEIQKTTFAHRMSNEEIRATREQVIRDSEARTHNREQQRLMHDELYAGAHRWSEYEQAMLEANAELDRSTVMAIDHRHEQELLAATVGIDSQRAFDDYQSAIQDAEQAESDFITTTQRAEKAMRDAAVAAMETADARLDTAMSYADYEEQITDSAEQFADKREKLETKHQEALAEIARRGQSWRQAVNEDELSLEVRIAQGRLDELLERQSKYNEETTDLERARTEQSIGKLQEEIAEKTSLLEQANEGFVMMKGENVDALLAEENRQYEESLLGLQESQAAQEEAQRQSLGRMVLNHFNAWAEMNLAADGYTQAEADFVTQMRQDISVEYGLITDTAVAAMDTQESKWAGMVAQMRGEASSFFDYFMKEFNKLPSEKVIRIRTELATPTTAGPTQGGDVMQHGSAFAPGGMALVGERGPELAYIPRGASVFPTDQSQHMTTNHYNLTVNSAATAMRVQDEFFMMQGLAGR